MLTYRQQAVPVCSLDQVTEVGRISVPGYEN